MPIMVLLIFSTNKIRSLEKYLFSVYFKLDSTNYVIKKSVNYVTKKY